MKKVAITNVEESTNYMGEIEAKIYNNELKSLREIQDYIFNTFDYMKSTFLNRDYYMMNALSMYIIHCDVTKSIPESGY